MPHTFWTFVVGSLALAGFPLTAGFFSKDEVLVGAQIWADNGVASGLGSAATIGSLVYWVGLAGAMVTTFYMSRAIYLIFFGEHRGAHHGHEDHGHGGGDDHAAHAEPELTHAVDEDGVERPVPAGGGGGGGGGHSTPHESGKQMLVPLVFLAVASFPVGFTGGFLWDDVGGSTEMNFETWTATDLIVHTEYPFFDEYEPYGEVVDGQYVAAAATDPGDGAAAAVGEGEAQAAPLAPGANAAPLAAAAGEEGKVSNHVLHGAPTFHIDVFVLALLGFLIALGAATVIYGRGKPDRDPTMHMGPFTTVLVEKYYLDTFGYKAIVVPIRDHLARWASQSSNDGRYAIDKLVAGAGVAAKHAATTTYRTLDQKVVDGAINGLGKGAGAVGGRLKRLQSGDVQRYAGAVVLGAVALVMIIALAIS